MNMKKELKGRFTRRQRYNKQLSGFAYEVNKSIWGKVVPKYVVSYVTMALSTEMMSDHVFGL